MIRFRNGFPLALLVAATVLAGCATVANADDSVEQEQRNLELVRNAFQGGVGGADGFYSILADDVEWTIARATEPTTYVGRQQFLDRGAQPILGRLTGPIQADIHELISNDDEVVALWRGTATAVDGRPYVNEYAWVMTLRDNRVSKVTAFLDLVALQDLMSRVALRS
jgi:ketosteroid isomerase-like protein